MYDTSLLIPVLLGPPLWPRVFLISEFRPNSRSLRSRIAPSFLSPGGPGSCRTPARKLDGSAAPWQLDLDVTWGGVKTPFRKGLKVRAGATAALCPSAGAL